MSKYEQFANEYLPIPYALTQVKQFIEDAALVAEKSGNGEIASAFRMIGEYVAARAIHDAEPGTMGTCGCVECCRAFNKRQG